MHNEETGARFVELRAENWSFARIATEIGVDKKTLCRWARERKVEIAELQNLKRDELRERLKLTETARMERLHKILEKLGERLGKNFSGNKCEPLSPMAKLYEENF